jgi:hypothetical protein
VKLIQRHRNALTLGIAPPGLIVVSWPIPAGPGSGRNELGQE